MTRTYDSYALSTPEEDDPEETNEWDNSDEKYEQRRDDEGSENEEE